MEPPSKRLRLSRVASRMNRMVGSRTYEGFGATTGSQNESDAQEPLLNETFPDEEQQRSSLLPIQISTSSPAVITPGPDHPMLRRRRADQGDMPVSTSVANVIINDPGSTDIAKLTLSQVPTVVSYPSEPPLTVPAAPSVTPLTVSTDPAYPFISALFSSTTSSSGSQVVISSSPLSTPGSSSSTFSSSLSSVSTTSTTSYSSTTSTALVGSTTSTISLPSNTTSHSETSTIPTIPAVLPSTNLTITTSALTGVAPFSSINGTWIRSSVTPSTLLTSITSSVVSLSSTTTTSHTKTGHTGTAHTTTSSQGSAQSSTAGYGIGGIGAASSSTVGAGGEGGAAASSTSTPAPGGASDSNTPTTPVVVGSVIGGLAGLTLILVFFLYLFRHHRRRLDRQKALQSTARDSAPPPPTGTTVMSHPSSHTPLTAAVTSAFLSRWRHSGQSSSTAETALVPPTDRGFQRLGGRKIEGVLTGSDQYGGDYGVFEQQRQPPSVSGAAAKETETDSSTGGRELAGTSFYRDSAGFYGGRGSAPGTPGTTAHRGLGATANNRDSDAPSEIAVMRPSPARMPVTTSHGPTPAAAAVPSRLAQEGQDGVGRSHADGSKGSRFTESV